MLIPLSTINVKTVLDGARVPLHHPLFPHDRWEWIGDGAICSIDPEEQDFLNCGTTDSLPASLALDPTDPTTAALIDRRVAEALYRNGEPTAALLWVDDVTGPRWRMSVISPTGMTQEIYVTHVCLSGLDPTPGNLPEARRRLLTALYPPVAP